MKHITTPLLDKELRKLKAGDEVLLSGVVYTCRDQAHKRLTQALQKKQRLPFPVKGAIIYYCGPTQTPKGRVIGSCGPTTSSRMDAFTPALLNSGLKGMIGKGRRSPAVVKALKKSGGVYFLAFAGCGALIARCVKKARIVAYKDLGPEAIRRLEVKDLPLIVCADAKGKNLYE